MAKKSTGRHATGDAGGTPGRNPTGRDPVLDAAMALAAEKGWGGLTLAGIAAAAGVPLVELYQRYTTRQAILDGIRRAVDRAMLAGGPVPDGPAYDRLFEVLMRRFDALRPWRPGIVAVAEAKSRDPLALLCDGPGLHASMAAALEAAGLDASGLRGLIRAQALAAAWLPALRVWLTDEGEDQAATMAALDKGLRRLDRLARLCRRPAGPAPEAAGRA